MFDGGGIMSKEVDELVDSVTNIGKYLIKRIVSAAQEAERAVAPSGSDDTGSAVSTNFNVTAATFGIVDFHLGEWRRFCDAGEAYLVVAPLRQEKGEWIMRVQLKDGTQAEYPLSNILRNPPLQGAQPLMTETDGA